MGDPAAAEIDWADFFGRYRPLAVRVAIGLVGREELAEELVQEAARSLFERAHRGEARFETTIHARNSFLRAIKNLAVSAARRSGRRPVERSITDSGEPAAPALEPRGGPLDTRLAAALLTLTAVEREVLRMRYVEGLAYREIADRTGSPISTLHARVEVALKKIRGRIGNGAPPA